MPLPILALLVAIGCCLNFIIAGFFGVRFLKSYQKNKSPRIKHLSLFFIFIAVFLFFSTLPHVFGVGDAVGLFSISIFKPFLPSIGIWSSIIGYVFLFLSLAFFITIPISLSKFSDYKKSFFSLVIILGIIFTIINLFGEKKLITDPFTQANVVALSPSMLWLLMVALAVSLVPFLIISIAEIIKNVSPAIKTRAALFTLGLLMIVARIISHDFLHGIILHVTWDLLCSIGLILIGVGIYFVKLKKEEFPLKKQPNE